MFAHRLITYDQFLDYKTKIHKWTELLHEIHELLRNLSGGFESHKERNSYREYVASQLTTTQFFTFSSIAILIENAHFSDAFALLRILYERHLHLWNICSGDEEQAKRFYFLSIIQEWKLALDSIRVDKEHLQEYYYNEERLKNLEEAYNQAITFFNARPGKIPGNYTTISNENLAKVIDDTESNGKPLRQLMHISLYSVGSEFIHSSQYGMLQGYVVVQLKEPDRYAPFPNPNKGIEAAWWASNIILDSLEWYCRFIKHDLPEETRAITDKVRAYGEEWLQETG